MIFLLGLVLSTAHAGHQSKSNGRIEQQTLASFSEKMVRKAASLRDLKECSFSAVQSEENDKTTFNLSHILLLNSEYLKKADQNKKGQQERVARLANPLRSIIDEIRSVESQLSPVARAHYDEDRKAKNYSLVAHLKQILAMNPVDAKKFTDAIYSSNQSLSLALQKEFKDLEETFKKKPGLGQKYRSAYKESDQLYKEAMKIRSQIRNVEERLEKGSGDYDKLVQEKKRLEAKLLETEEEQAKQESYYEAIRRALQGEMDPSFAHKEEVETYLKNNPSLKAWQAAEQQLDKIPTVVDNAEFHQWVYNTISALEERGIFENILSDLKDKQGKFTLVKVEDAEGFISEVDLVELNEADRTRLGGSRILSFTPQERQSAESKGDLKKVIGEKFGISPLSLPLFLVCPKRVFGTQEEIQMLSDLILHSVVAGL